jgi:hypothetical protein
MGKFGIPLYNLRAVGVELALPAGFKSSRYFTKTSFPPLTEEAVALGSAYVGGESSRCVLYLGEAVELW